MCFAMSVMCLLLGWVGEGLTQCNLRQTAVRTTTKVSALVGRRRNPFFCSSVARRAREGALVVVELSVDNPGAEQPYLRDI